MIRDFNDYIKEERLFSPRDRILLTVSGGIDSMVMTNLFLHSDFDFGICHCNFSLRGEESDMDEEFVRKSASERDIPFFTIRFDTHQYADSHKVSIQVAARELRYEWFEKIRRENGYDFIATAHNQNDNIETVLLNLTRGSGLIGLSGIRNKNGYIIRPLLFATRARIAEYAKNEGVEYREDSSNASTKYSRNKIRHLVVPTLKKINPSLESSISKSAMIISQLNDVVTQYVNETKQRFFRPCQNGYSISIQDLSTIQNRSIVFELFKEFSITSDTLDDILNMTTSNSGKQVFTATHRFVKNRDELLVCPIDMVTERVITIDSIDDFSKIPSFTVERITVDDDFKISANPHLAYIDCEKVVYPLTIRRWKAGDCFIPLGMRGFKKISDYLIDRKLSIIDKEKIDVLVSDNNIVWIVGERLDDRYKITPATKEVLVLSHKP